MEEGSGSDDANVDHLSDDFFRYASNVFNDVILMAGDAKSNVSEGLFSVRVSALFLVVFTTVTAYDLRRRSNDDAAFSPLGDARDQQKVLHVVGK